jgi:hypothetical protein
MNKEKQRIAIAEACGWIDIKRGPYDGRPFGRYKTHQLEGVPDYLNDLNAMHEAEMVLHGQLNLWWNYMDALEKASVEFDPLGRGSHIHATAAQRAQAFLRTIGKWEDDK